MTSTIEVFLPIVIGLSFLAQLTAGPPWDAIGPPCDRTLVDWNVTGGAKGGTVQHTTFDTRVTIPSGFLLWLSFARALCGGLSLAGFDMHQQSVSHSPWLLGEGSLRT